MSTLFQATLDLARLLMNVHEGTVSGIGGGGAITFDDSANPEADDYYNGGCIWWTGPTPTVGTGLNVGKTRETTDFDGTTNHRFSFDTTTALTAVLDTYCAAPATYPRGQLRQFINQALKSIGAIPTEDATLVTVADQEEYDLPTGVVDVRRVEVSDSLTSPYEYKRQRNWYQIGSHLRFITDYVPGEASYKIRLTHQAAHTELTTDAGVISDMIHPDLLMWRAMTFALRWRLKQIGGDDKDLLRMLADAIQKDNEMTSLHPIPDVQKDAILGGYSETPASW